MRDVIRFLRRGRPVELKGFAPTLTLLDYLRLQERSLGTKEGCAEGDCGACTIVLGSLRDGNLRYEPVNACIHLLGMVDGKEVLTVEDLAGPEGRLHPVQQAMADHHGSQCGFCTPGFVMALFALYHRAEARPPGRQGVNDWLAGNLCRCTGYRPIVDAALAACTEPPRDRFSERAAETTAVLRSLQDADDILVGTPDRFFAAPARIESLAALYDTNPDATLVAGATDVGLWVTKGFRDLPKVIHLSRVNGLNEIAETEDELVLGATATHTQALSHLTALDPDLGELWRRFGSVQIRAVGTIGGNIANGSPIGDAAPALIALGAAVELQKGEAVRNLPLEAFFLAYGKQDRRPGEFVRRLRIPKPRPDRVFRCFKVTKRFDEDISAVMGAFRLDIDGRQVRSARIAFGGMAATPKRAAETEGALSGAGLDAPAAWEAALTALGRDFTPISDQRAGAAYRMDVARALLRKALIEAGGRASADTRIIGHREARLASLA